MVIVTGPSSLFGGSDHLFKILFLLLRAAAPQSRVDRQHAPRHVNYTQTGWGKWVKIRNFSTKLHKMCWFYKNARLQVCIRRPGTPIPYLFLYHICLESRHGAFNKTQKMNSTVNIPKNGCFSFSSRKRKTVAQQSDSSPFPAKSNGEKAPKINSLLK